MSIQIIDPRNVLVDGQMFGGVDVVLVMYPGRLQDIQLALQEYVARLADENQGLIQQLASALSKIPALEQENANLRNQIQRLSQQSSEDWNGLLSDLISPAPDAPKLYEQCYRASAMFLECNAAFTVFITTLTSVRIPAALQDAIARLQNALEATNNPIDEEAKSLAQSAINSKKNGVSNLMQKDFFGFGIGDRGGFLLGLGTTLFAVVAWFAQSTKKRYAAERDFEHLKRNYQQLAEGQARLMDELEERADRLQNALERQQMLLQVVLAKVSGGDESIGTMLNNLRQK